MSSIHILPPSQCVVDLPGFTIQEMAGNVTSKDSRVSIAHVKAKAGTSEPFLTVHYDEWIHILKGKILLETEGGNVIAKAGDTALVPKGSRFRPSFPEDTEYIPVCLPAFKQILCIREDQNSTGNNEQLNTPPSETAGSCTVEENAEILYHMTTKVEWDTAVARNHAYYPRTFECDGNYTHATAVPGRLVETANHFYQDVDGEWICLQFRRSVLRNKFGIVVKDEEAMPVGEKKVAEDWEEGKRGWICPHVYGGIPLDCVEKIYPMTREGVKFVGIEGLV